MHLLIALKCPSSHSLFFLGFYLESCYNLCHAIRFLSAGSGRECECRAGEGAPSLVNRRRRGSGSCMCASAHPREPAALPVGWQSQDSSQPRTDQLAGQQWVQSSPKVWTRRMIKQGEKIPRWSLSTDGNCAHSSGKLAGEGGAGYPTG